MNTSDGSAGGQHCEGRGKKPVQNIICVGSSSGSPGGQSAHCSFKLIQKLP